MSVLRKCVCTVRCVREKALINKGLNCERDKLTLRDIWLNTFIVSSAENKYQVSCLGVQIDTLLRPASLPYPKVCHIKTKQEKKLDIYSTHFIQVNELVYIYYVFRFVTEYSFNHLNNTKCNKQYFYRLAVKFSRAEMPIIRCYCFLQFSMCGVCVILCVFVGFCVF